MTANTASIVRVSRPLLVALAGASLLASLAASDASAASFSIRLEAGPHPAVTFSSTWRVTASKTVTYSKPVTVSGARRVNVPDRGWHLKVSSGTLAGWWVKENRVAYVPGFVGTTTWTRLRHLAMPAGRWELYRFDAAGAMTRAKGRTITTHITTHVDRTSVIDGRRYVRIAGGTWAGWWVPGSLGTPRRITCSAGSPPAGTAGRRVSSVPAATGEIALTFDMGGRLTPALDIIRFLELERVCATVFPTGIAAQTTIGMQVMAEIRAHPELFELGNHTVHHCDLRDGGGGSACPATRPSTEFVTAELQDADALIAGLAGRPTTPYWRPPYGAVDATLVDVAAAAGFPYTIMWSTDTIDWRTVANGGPTAAQIAAKVIANRTPGGIVLMHLGGYNTRPALPAMIEGLIGAGYRATSISALFR